MHHGAAKFVQIDELCLVRFQFIHFNISLLMSGERHKVLDTLDHYHLLGSGLQSTTNQIYILYLNRENKSPNSDIIKQLVKNFRRWSKSKMILCAWRGEF